MVAGGGVAWYGRSWRVIAAFPPIDNSSSFEVSGVSGRRLRQDRGSGADGRLAAGAAQGVEDAVGAGSTRSRSQARPACPTARSIRSSPVSWSRMRRSAPIATSPNWVCCSNRGACRAAAGRAGAGAALRADAGDPGAVERRCAHHLRGAQSVAAGVGALSFQRIADRLCSRRRHGQRSAAAEPGADAAAGARLVADAAGSIWRGRRGGARGAVDPRVAGRAGDGAVPGAARAGQRSDRQLHAARRQQRRPARA